ncbi:ergothioneine biosynthesis protein EgtB [Synechocystis sp. LEGE 06083]|uniref:SUMF1/EgtB/PvdO family nonheme iron enzyme n=1 Tax=Synechocystis sp. LEGE 06083 TaxID=915336 RepID=UPI00187ECF59|nr:ergothioneine biosynthesis protein EgtB [Synechocystis sp. LEGE 06083]
MVENIETIGQAMERCRQETLRLLHRIPPALGDRQWHPDFSPIDWHFGHIAFTEALWLLPEPERERFHGPAYQKLFRADGLPKAQRCALPDRDAIEQYLGDVRAAVERVWQSAPSPWDQGKTRLWWWLLQHEVQHSETISFLSHLAGIDLGVDQPHYSTDSQKSPLEAAMVAIPAGAFCQGSEQIWAQDNERPAHGVEVEQFWLDKYPVTQAQYQQFIDGGGYQQSKYWTEAGWQWRSTANITAPLYWQPESKTQDHPVYGVSAYEAEAYAHFVGKRLPTEQEWERAARWSGEHHSSTYPWGEALPSLELCNFNNHHGQTTPVNYYDQGLNQAGCYDLLGNVWEWTASTFEPYKNFQPYPYRGYSQVYFDGEHRVMRGGSWATRSWGLRASFRNWYHPWIRQVLVGFRCAS